MATFGEVLRKIRKERGLTQGQLAYKSDTTPEYISMLERSTDRAPGTKLLVRLTRGLGITPDYILARAGMLELNGDAPLAPEVQHIPDILASWPESSLKANARQVVITVAETLAEIRRLDGEGNGENNREQVPVPRGTSTTL